MPSLSRDKRATSPKERIIPIEIEGGKSRSRMGDTSHYSEPSKSNKKKSVIEIKREDNQDKWEVKVEEPKQTKSKESKKDAKEAKKDISQKESKKEVKEVQLKPSKGFFDSKKDTKKDATKKDVKDITKKESKKDLKKRDTSKVEMDENRNVIDKSSKLKKKDDTKEDDKKKDKGKEKHKDTSDPEVTITTQPSKSILKQPIAASTPLPDAPHDSSWTLDRSTASTGTVVRKKTPASSKCCSWLCMPCGLCCACAPFECECCDCCYLKCTRCGEQCLCQCCNRKCC